MWRDLFTEGVVIAGDEFPCAAVDYEGRDEGVLADDAHDRWVDEQSEVL